MRLYNFVLFLLLYVLRVNSQMVTSLEYGQDAKYVLRFIKEMVRNNHMVDNFGNRGPSNTTYDVKYYDGKISDVIICCAEQYLPDFELVANFCRHHMMEDEKYSYTLTQYENVSLERLKSIYDTDDDNVKYDKYYFTKGYKYCSELYLSRNGYATVKQTLTGKSKFSKKVKKWLDKIVNEQNK